MQQDFETVAWAKGSNIYEVNLRQYTNEGTFAAFEKELPRLRDMGVEILWFMPITPISVEGRQGPLGSYYACSSYNTTNPEFGTIEDFRKLVAEAHLLGFKVIIDWVCNHTGLDHEWTGSNPEFFKQDENNKFYDAYGWVDVIDLDFSNKDLRKALVEAMKFWINDCDIDGFRCDMAHLVPLDFWREARAILDKEKELFWLAETEEAAYHQVFDATYAWQMLHTMEAVYRAETGASGIMTVVESNRTAFPQHALRAYFTSNHDENSHSGSEYDRMGNAARAFAVICALLPNGIPLIYSGQELPNKKQLQFFDRDPIEWNGEYLLHDFYRTLLNLRKTSPAIQDGSATFLTTTEEGVFCILWQKNEQQVLVLVNLSARNAVRFALKDVEIRDTFKNIFSGIASRFTKNSFELQAWEYLVYEKIGFASDEDV